ncbi:cobalamin-binding protein [Tepidiforma sp.]|uniref:cobalamin-binding protein n=1 Tax=Tepidiforma sp. TaxID=2682230 RepID=UPI002ADE80CD|nr:cobalamin-binding protein [Tepidiforma sp.]
MGPRRIVCLTAETTEVAFAVGAGDRVVGVSGYAVRPPEARQRPKVAAFQTAAIDRILALEPDLVLGFSDIQAPLAAELIRAGVTVLVTNQRTLQETYAAIELIGAACGEPERGRALAREVEAELETVAGRSSRRRDRRPRVYFEEWNDPLITGIAWVSELIELCGGEDVFAGMRAQRRAPDRVVQPGDVLAAAPEVIIASWCGKKARLERIAARPGWDALPAVRNGHLYEIKSADILAPGPSLVHGARQLAAILDRVTGAA